MRAPCRVCRRECAVTRRGLAWGHGARAAWGPPLGRCPGAGQPPLGRPGPDLAPLSGQRLDPDPVVREHPGGTVYLLCLDTPYKHARHYLGYAGPGNLAARLAHHRAGSGANLMRVVGEAGIGWRLTRTWPGDRARERQIKAQGGASRCCPRCRPSIAGHLLARLAA